MFIFKSTEQRDRYIRALGSFYAGLGGTFGAYREASEAFRAARSFGLYRRVELSDSDLTKFKEGFMEFQKLRIALQKASAAAQNEMKEILKEVDLLGLGDKLKDYKDVSELLAAQSGE